MAYRKRVLAGAVAVAALGCMLFGGQMITAAGDVHWGYSGASGPDNWGKLSGDFETCVTGRAQSPFDIKADIRADLPELQTGYKPVPLVVVNNGHTIQVPYAGDSILKVDRSIYRLLQFHFHTPSEHTIEGRSFPLEVHFVHASEEGALAVIGVMIEQGAANPHIARIWDAMPAHAGDKVVTDMQIDATSLFPGSKGYFRFMGSLTTPPCSEGVNWHVMTTPISMSKQQIATFRKIFAMNARPLQPENNRLVVMED